MILRLAEYKENKFEKFLEVGQDFLFGEKFITVSQKDISTEMSAARNVGEENLIKFYYLDKTDPLNRFNGLFDGRTYGDGRFILIERNQDDVSQIKEEKKHVLFRKNKDGSHSRSEEEKIISEVISYRLTTPGLFFHRGSGSVIETKWNGDEIWEEKQQYEKIIGNLHENPELFERLA